MKIRPVWIVLFFGTISFFGLFFIPSRGEYVRLAIQSHEYDLAHRLLKPYLARESPPEWALSDAATVEIRRGYPEKAAACLEELLVQTPRNTSERLRLARLYLSMNHLRKALLHYAFLAHQNDVSPGTFHEAVRLDDLLNRSRSVIGLYHRLLRAEPKNLALWKELVRYDRATGHLVDEKQALGALLRREPHRQDYLRELIALEYALGDYQSVVGLLLRPGAQNGDLSPVLLEGVRSFLHLDRAIQGYLLYRRLASNVTSNDAIEGIAWIFYHHRYRTLALSVFGDLARRAPDNRIYLDDEVWLAEKLGWFEQARGILEEIARKNLDTPENARRRLLDLSLRHHRWGIAQADLIRWTGKGGSDRLSVLRLFADYAQDRNNLPLAIQLLRQANTLFPGNRATRESLATLYRWNNQPGSAGALLFALALADSEKRPDLLRAVRQFEDADLPEPAKGVLFRILARDSKRNRMDDLEHLFALYEESPRKTGLGHLARIVRRYPEHFGSKNLLIAQTFVWEKRVRAAGHTVDALVRAYPANRAILFRASRWFADLDRPDLALRYDWKAYRMNPSDPAGILDLTRHLQWTGRTAALPKLWRRLLKVEPDNRRALTALGDDLYDRGDYAQALVYYRKIFRSGQAGHRVLFRIAESYDRLGNRKQAFRFYRRTRAVLSSSGRP